MKQKSNQWRNASHAEMAISITARMYEYRRTLKAAFGGEYDKLIKDSKDIILAACVKHKCSIVEAPVAISKDVDKQDAAAFASSVPWLSAAVCDLIEQEDKTVVKSIGKFEIIPTSHELYEALKKLINKCHEHLSDAKIVLVWQSDLKPSPEKKIQLGKCIKVGDRDKLLHGNDFAIILNKDIYESDMLNDKQRTAILDHELCHAQVKRDKKGKVKFDDDGKPIYRVRKHDLEEFRQIVERHGCYANDIIDFVRTALASKDSPLLADKDTGEVKTA